MSLTLGLTDGLSLGVTGGGTPWYEAEALKADDTSPVLALDFENNRYAVNGASASLSDIVTHTRASTATYVDSSGVIQTASTDELRFDHDPSTLAPKGALIEVAATNLFTYSNLSTGWTNIGLSQTSTTESSPDANNEGVEITTTSTGHRFDQTVSLTSGVTYTVSFWAKRGTMSDVKYSALGSGVNVSPTSYYADINSSGWARISFDITPTSTGNVIIYPVRDSGVTGTTYVWGAQVEAGTFATSYIPTSGSTVTRASDHIIGNSSNTIEVTDWYNTTASTVYTEATLDGAGAYPYIYRLSDASTANFIQQTSGSQTDYYLEFKINSGSVQQYKENPAGVLAYGDSHKCALAVELNDTISGFNGSTGTQDTSVTMPTGIDTLTIFNKESGSSIGTGTIKKLLYYPIRVTDSELERITT